jgi:protein-tyrosine phosphatase
MEKAHKEYIKRVFGKDEGVHLLTEYVGEEGGIPDPYGGCIESYRECFQRIKGCIKRMVERWKLWH